MENSTAWRIANRFASLAPEQRREFLQKMQAQGVSFGQLPIPATAPADGLCELSYAQQRQWFLWQLDPEGAAYHIPAALRLRGGLNVDALQHSFDALLRRHHSLRSVFVEHDGQVQCSSPPAPTGMQLTRHDLRDLATAERMPRA